MIWDIITRSWYIEVQNLEQLFSSYEKSNGDHFYRSKSHYTTNYAQTKEKIKI